MFNLLFTKPLDLGLQGIQEYVTAPLIRPKLGLESGFSLITFSHPYLVTTTFKINFGKKIFAPCKSSSLGMGCLYFTLMLLMDLQFVHSLHLPSFFSTNNIGTTQRLRLSWTQPFSNNSLTWDSISLVSWGLFPYAGLLGRLVPGNKSIWCSIPWEEATQGVSLWVIHHQMLVRVLGPLGKWPQVGELWQC